MADSSSVKATPVRGPRGFDGAKKIDGIKRHITVDTTGLLVAVHITPANVGGPGRVPRLAKTIRKIWLDKGYTGPTVAAAAQKAGGEVEIVFGPKPTHGFVVQPRRWVAHQRLDQPPPTTRPAAREHHRRTRRGFLVLSQIGLLQGRLDRGQLFDTL